MVGNKRILLILYKPIPSQTKLRAKKTNLGVVKVLLASSKCAKALWTAKMLVKGLVMAVVVVLIEKMLSWDPDIHSMKAFIKIC